MEIFDRLEDMELLVEQSKMLPLSQSCVVNKEEILSLLADVRAVIPTEIREAEYVIRQRDDLLRDAEHETSALRSELEAWSEQVKVDADYYYQQVTTKADLEAQRRIEVATEHARGLVESHTITTTARSQADQLVSDAQQRANQVLAQAQTEANRLLTQAQRQSEALLAGAEDALSNALNEIARTRSQQVQQPQAHPSRHYQHHHGVFDYETDAADMQEMGSRWPR